MLLEWLALDLCSHITYGFFATDITASLYLRSWTLSLENRIHRLPEVWQFR